LSSELMQALNEIEKDRGIPKSALIDAIKSAINTAYKKNFGIAQNIDVDIDENTGEVKVFAQKKVLEEVEDSRVEINLDEARELYSECKVDDLIYVEVTPSDFGRIAAQTAKQVVIQKLREAERSLIYAEFSEREGEVVTGTVERKEAKTVFVALGRTEGIMLHADQMSGEKYEVGMRIKAYIYEVKNTSKGPNVFVSRSHPCFLRRLFELEVPEIYDGIVEIKSIAREAGARSKIAVHSLEEKVDSVGACVGPRGIRVQNIVSELGGEKIDIIKYDKSPEHFIANALSPSKVDRVFLNEEEKIATVVVPDYQLSLAIGKEGQNARLAAKLTNWKVDIKSESQFIADNAGQIQWRNDKPSFTILEDDIDWSAGDETEETDEYGEDA